MNPGSSLAWALYYASQGLEVLPVHHPVTDASGATACSCGDKDCPSPAKHPMTSSGVNDATTDPNVITKWFTDHPYANIGLRMTGHTAVLDVDVKNQGDVSLDQIERQHGPLPRLAVVDSGGGGSHHYFNSPTLEVRTKLGFESGLDLIGRNGYIVAPPSRHISGGVYSWRHDAIQTQSVPAIPKFLLATQGTNQAPAQSVQSGAIPTGNRNSTLTSIAGSLWARGLDQDIVASSLLSINAACCEPPLPDKEVVAVATSVCGRYPRGNNPQATLGPDAFRWTEEVLASPAAGVQWLLKSYIAVGVITMFTGVPKGGKSTFYHAGLCAIATGAEFLGSPTLATPVVVLTEERDNSYRQLLERTGLAQVQQRVRVLTRDRASGVPWKRLVELAVDECHRIGAKILVIDTLADFALVGKAENESGVVLESMAPLADAAATGLAVVVIRHSRKAGGDVAVSGRGSSAFEGKADIVVAYRDDVKPGSNLRLLEAISRFDETPRELVVEWTQSGFVARGSRADVGRQSDLSKLANLLSTTDALTVKEVRTKFNEDADRNRSRSYIKDLLDRLVADGKVNKVGKGVSGDPLKYHRTRPQMLRLCNAGRPTQGSGGAGA